jgi:hypothetical protein
MRPSTSELLTSIAEQLGTQVLPSVQDKWAASTVRSAMQLLRHLALRAEHEPRLLVEEAVELQLLLTQVAASLQATSLSGLRSEVLAALQLPDAAAHDLSAQNARDEAQLRTVEKLIAKRDAIRTATGSNAVHDALVTYLERRLQREHQLIEPFRTTPPI